MKVSATGMPWYEEQDYEELRRLFVDGERLHATYAEWRRAAELGVQSFERSGERLIRVPVSPAAFKTWCDARGKRPDSAARNEYAAEYARDVVRREQGN